jgi:hypothetical protein
MLNGLNLLCNGGFEMKRAFFYPLLAAAFLLSGCATNNGTGKMNREYEVYYFNNFPYQSFILNWDNNAMPVYYGLIQTARDFDTYFGAAATGFGPNKNTKPYAPGNEEFKNYSYIFVSRVTSPKENGSHFVVKNIAVSNSEMSIYYSFTENDTVPSYQIKDGFMVRIRKESVNKIKIFENNTSVGEIERK